MEQKSEVMASFSTTVTNATTVEQVIRAVNGLKGELYTLKTSIVAPLEIEYTGPHGAALPQGCA